MYYIEVALFALGVVLLITGYRRNRRNMLLAAAIVLFMSAATGPFVEGYQEGYSRNQDSHS
jgi:disulfide bond formation protein DsbB